MNKIQYNKDVGQSILESYSRVTESLAFNIMARIDDVLFVDDATKQCAAAGIHIPLQQRRIRRPPYPESEFSGSPERVPPSQKRGNPKEASDQKLEKPLSPDFERVWSYAGNISSRRVSGDAPERD
uniref:PRONE domain-containing protein n=1 Tax=Populus alba TaxID=43335 RepID=A0A4U5QUI7_POPAL|nr:hypothetical protein D5086_0000039230 [Populus alba]